MRGLGLESLNGGLGGLGLESFDAGLGGVQEKSRGLDFEGEDVDRGDVRPGELYCRAMQDSGEFSVLERTIGDREVDLGIGKVVQWDWGVIGGVDFDSEPGEEQVSGILLDGGGVPGGKDVVVPVEGE